MGEAAPVIELRGIEKRFPGVVANHDVHLSALPGEVHAIVGENGAGKSTLMNVLYGLQRPDRGEIVVRGEAVRMASPADAIRLGIGMVHQHQKLADNLSVVENVIIGAEPRSGVTLDLDRAARDLGAIAERYGLPIDPRARVESLGVGLRQRVEILKVLYRGAGILVLDEPTAVLVPREVDELIGNLRRLASEGLVVIFISHKLDEVLAVADRITVMRAGTTVATVLPTEVTARELARLMVGADLPEGRPRTSAIRDEVALEVEALGLVVDDGIVRLRDVSLRVRRGEIVGVAGVEGNGQGDLVEAILGLVAPTSGVIRIAGLDITRTGPGARRRMGVAHIPQDRQREGLLLDAPLWENRILGYQHTAPNSRGPWLTTGAARADTRRIVAESDVRTPSIDVAASALSGGNQQKLIVGRELSGSPRLLLAAHPTRGVDVGAQAAIWARLGVARDEGLAVLLVSADLGELVALSDRIVVMLRGRIVAEFTAGAATIEALGAAMTGAPAAGSSAAGASAAGPA
jgi:simple sugar transport system ATP-binding protein